MCQELRRRDWSNLRCVVLDVEQSSRLPLDLHDLFDGGAELRALLDGAQHLHCVDLDPEQHDVAGVPLELLRSRLGAENLTIHLSERPSWLGPTQLAAWATRMRDAGSFVTAGVPSLAQELGVECMPAFVPWWRSRWTPILPKTRARESINRPKVVFASSVRPFESRPEFEAFIDRVQALPGDDWMLEVLTGRSQANVLARRRFAHLVLTRNQDGLALSALESLVQGVPVVAELDDLSVKEYAKLAGGDPPPVIAPNYVEAAIANLSAKAEAEPSLVAWGRRLLAPERWFRYCEAHWAGRAGEGTGAKVA